MNKIITVFNTKGGVGKTTIALNIGSFIAARGYRTLLVDLDPQCNLTSSLKIEVGAEGRNPPAGKSIYELATETPTPKPFQLCQKAGNNLFLMSGSERILNLESELTKSPDPKRAAQLLSTLFAPYRNIFDYIIFDCSPHAGLISGNALAASDFVIAPVMPTYYCLKGTGRLLRIINGIKLNLNPRLELLGLVIDRYKYTRANARIVAELRAVAEGQFRVFGTVIPEAITVEEAHMEQMPLLNYSRSSKAGLAFEGLTAEILEITEQRHPVSSANPPLATGQQSVNSSGTSPLETVPGAVALAASSSNGHHKSLQDTIVALSG